MVDDVGGAATVTCSPQFENFVVPEPLVELAVSSTGSAAPLAEIETVFTNFGVELVAAVVHLRMKRLVPLLELVETEVPFAGGSTAVTAAMVDPDFRVEYWLVPAFTDIHF